MALTALFFRNYCCLIASWLWFQKPHGTCTCTSDMAFPWLNQWKRIAYVCLSYDIRNLYVAGGCYLFCITFCVIQRKRHEYIDLLILGWCAGCHSYGLRHSVLEQLYVGLLGMILQFHFRMADRKAPMLSPWDWRDCNIHTHISVILMFQFKPTQDIRSTQDGTDSSFQKTPYSKTSSYFYIWQAFTIWYRYKTKENKISTYYPKISIKS